MRFGPWEIVLIVLLVIILFGAKRIPDLMRSLGIGIKEFKSGLNELDDKQEQKNDQSDSEEKSDDRKHK